MYQSNIGAALRARSRNARASRPGLNQVQRNVWLLGLTSLLTDMSSEMVTAVLPLYAIYFLHLSPLAFGVVDGLQQGGASLVKLASGWFTDRSGWYKGLAASGYAASALSRLGLLVGGPSASLLAPLVALDRIGKGIRTAPRDAIISLSVNRASLATAFGVHRALDTCGALLGPIVGFLVLRWIRDGYDVIFVFSFALAAIGIAVLVAFVDPPPAVLELAPEPEARRLSALPSSFWRVAGSAAVLGLASISDSFIYLSLQRRLGFSSEYLPLLYMATPAIYLTLAAPAGRLADRIGTARVIVAGYAAMLALYFVLTSGLPPQMTALLCVVLLGTFYATTDGVFAALASAVLPTRQRATGLALVGTLNDVGRMVASLAFGWLWTREATAHAVVQFQMVLIVGIAVAAALLWPILAGNRSPESHG